MARSSTGHRMKRRIGRKTYSCCQDNFLQICISAQVEAKPRTDGDGEGGRVAHDWW